MNNLVLGCRNIETLCRQRAISDRAHSWKWLGEADRWSDLAHREIAFVFKIIKSTPVPWQWDQTPLTATHTGRSGSRGSANSLHYVADDVRTRARQDASCIGISGKHLHRA
jgi:hypothetical protein